MATQKPISTISYNTPPFLKEKLDSWVKAHIIQAYQFICHKGEDGDKDHIHLRIEPNKKLDPMDLQEQLRQFPLGSDKPLGCRPFRASKEEDWILYAVHDEDYLKLKYGGAEKGEKLPYEWQDIQCSEYYDMEVAYIRAKAYLKHTSVNMATRIQNGERPMDMILTGENPYLVNAIMKATSDFDYRRVLTERDDALRDLFQLQDRYQKLVDAVENFGLSISIDADDNFRLEFSGTGNSWPSI